MDYRASAMAISQKLSNGLSIYDGVFSSAPPSKFNASSFSSRVEDFCEIFGGSSSIPVLEVPELRERKASVDVRSSKLDYSKVFGGFGDSDFAVPYEEFLVQPKKNEKLHKKRRTRDERSSSEGADPSDLKGNAILSQEASHHSFDGSKKFNMSFNKSNPRSKSFSGGTTRIAELDAVPAYTCLIDEVTPSHMTTECDKPASFAPNDAGPDSNLCERIVEGNQYTKDMDDHFASDASKETAKVQIHYDCERSSSNDEVFIDTCEIGEGIHPSSRPPISSLLSEDKVEFEKPMASTCQIPKSDHFEGSGCDYSCASSDDEETYSSVAAASIANLRKAIEKAQARIQLAKESKETMKVGLQNRVKLSFSSGTKLEARKGDKFTDKPSISQERKTHGLHEEVAVPVHFSTGPEQVPAAFKDADKLSGAMEAREETFADKAQERRTQELHEEVAVPVRFFTGPEQLTVALKDATNVSGAMEAGEVTFADRAQERKTQWFHEEVTAAFRNADKLSGATEAGVATFTDKAQERKTPWLNEEVTVPVQLSTGLEQVAAEFKDTDRLSGAMEAAEETFADKASIPKEKKTRGLHEIIAGPVHFSTKPEQNILSGATAGEEIQEKESTLIQGSNRQEECDLSEAAEQFYEFADEGEPDVSEESEQFYEFADTSEPDSVDQYYEFSDSSEHQATISENEEAKTTIEVSEFVVKNEQEKTKTTTEAFGNPELGGERLQVAEEEENRELQKILDADRMSCGYEEHAIEAFDREELKRLEAAIEHEDAGKDSHVKEEKLADIEKQQEVTKRLDTQELQDTKPAKRKLMAQESVEYENISKEACKQEEHETKQINIHRDHIDENTERRFNEDGRQEIIEEALYSIGTEEDFEKEIIEEALYSIGTEEDFERRLKDGSKSKGNEKLQSTGESEKILEGATCQNIEFEKAEVAGEDLKYPECYSEAGDNLCDRGESEDLNNNQGASRPVEYDTEVEETLEVLEHEEDWVTVEVSETLVELTENGNQSELNEEDSCIVEKEIHEDSGDMGNHAEEKDAEEYGDMNNNMMEESGDINDDMMEAKVFVNQEEKNSKSSHRKRWFDRIDISETLIKLKENGYESELAEEENVTEEKEICETDGLVPGVKLADVLKQMEDTVKTHPFDKDGINVTRNSMSYGGKQCDQIFRGPTVVGNLEKHIEELEEMKKDDIEAEVDVNQEENRNNSKSSQRRRWFDDGNNAEVAQLSHILRRKAVLLDHGMEPSLCTKENEENHKKILKNQRLGGNEGNQQGTVTEEGETIDSSEKELEQEKSESSAEESRTHRSSKKDVNKEKENEATLTTEESESNHTSQKEVEKEEIQQQTMTVRTSDSLQKEVEIEKEHMRQKANAKGRERERVKQKKAVERVIREAKERAFAEARERAAETRQRAQDRLGKTSVQANDSSLAEKASKDAKLNAERAAVERATEEARERALEKALSGKATYEVGRQAKRAVSEKFYGSSRDDGMKLGVSPSNAESKESFRSSTSGYPSTSNQDPCSAESSGNSQSAQRSKAKLEKNQRTAERAAKALAEKNMRDLLVQKEQAERNRLAESLDAEVKRWSNGKERNLRALLSTLQYILGPDSGWQPIPLTDVVTAVAVKKAYRKAALFVHPDKLQQRGASIQQKYTCEKVFDLLKEAWNRFNVEER